MSRTPLSHRPDAPASAASSVQSAVWLPDQGDGTYRNPVLFADYSDPDAIRVGDDYWLTASSFNHVPGLPILHSLDLVNWTLVNHALPRLVPSEHFSVPRHGEGVWAPAIRHHAGKFWLFYPDPDFGIYVTTTNDPRGSWSPPAMVKAGKGLIDPCPFWDDDGTGYLIHAWAKSRSGVKNRLTLHRLSADHMSVIDAGEIVIDGDPIPGLNTVEGPKLYKHQGYYYVFAPAGGVRDGYQVVFRARNIHGPYEHRIVLATGRTAINGPHQGAWVTSPDGGDWFLHFQELPAYGRVVHLQPVRWSNHWPVMGHKDNDQEPGEPVATHRKPLPQLTKPLAPATSDEFESSALGRQWQWQANPQPEWWSLTTAPGALRLACVSQPASESLWHAGHLLMQKFPAPDFVATTHVRFSPGDADGVRGGLVIFGRDYAWLGLRYVNGHFRLALVSCNSAPNGGVERELHTSDLPGDSAFLRVTVSSGGRCRFSFSIDGTEYHAIGEEFQAASSTWVGAKIGLFASSPEGARQGGHLDVRWFRITHSR